MQVLQWLFNIAAAPEPPKTVSKSTPKITQKKCDDQDKKMINRKDKVVGSSMNKDDRGRGRRHVDKSKLRCEDLLMFRFLQRKDLSRSFFYRTLNLKGLGSFRYSRKTTTTRTKEEEVARGHVDSNSTHGAGNKVLPIIAHPRNEDNQLFYNYSDDQRKKNKKKVVHSVVKELLKKVLKLSTNGGAASNVVVVDDDDESPKISITCCLSPACTSSTMIYTASMTSSTTSSSKEYDDNRIECGVLADMLDSTADLRIGVVDECAAGIGNWITTDSEFVVLEL